MADGAIQSLAGKLPNSGEVQSSVVKNFWYWGYLYYDLALNELKRAQKKKRPNEPGAFGGAPPYRSTARGRSNESERKS